MLPIDPNVLFSRAEQAFQQGNLASAQRDLQGLMKAVPNHPAILHLAGLVWRRLGRLEDARTFLDRAARLAPNDPQLCNNLGNVQSDLGHFQAAEKSYSRALRLAPTFTDALINRAIAWHKLGNFAKSRADFVTASKHAPQLARIWSALGAMEIDANEPAQALAAYDQALALQPDHGRALHGSARAALMLVRQDVVDRYEKALRAQPNDRDVLLGLAYARQASGIENPQDVLAAMLDADPCWAEGQRAWAEMLWEAGRTDEFAVRLCEALASQPASGEIRDTLCTVYAGVDQFEAAAQCAAEHPVGDADAPRFQLRQAIYAGDAGDTVRSAAVLATMDQDDPAVQMHTARNLIRLSEFDAADHVLEVLRQTQPENISIWALSDIVWRKLGDDRHFWLHGQPRLYGARHLPLDAGRLAAITTVVANAHTVHAAPIGQSLRGGTQTRGRLLARQVPEIVELRAAIVEAVNDHWNALPAFDPMHPLLKHRNTPPKLDGSWSVALNGSGYHVSHIHPQGLLSSACYLVVPPEAENAQERQGWLEIGSAPKDLAIKIDPLEAVQPEPGKMALFPSTLYHGTRPFGQGRRISVAFDIIV